MDISHRCAPLQIDFPIKQMDLEKICHRFTNNLQCKREIMLVNHKEHSSIIPKRQEIPERFSLLFFKSQWCQISRWDTMGGSRLYIAFERHKYNLLLHQTIEIITSLTVEINFTWINLTRSRGAHFCPMTPYLSQRII